MDERIPVVIPTMPERGEALLALRLELEAHPWAEVRISRHADSRLDVGAAVALANASAPAWWLYLEDDVTLSPRFGDIPRLIGEAAGLSLKRKPRPVGAVSFFRQADDLAAGLTVIPAAKFYMAQCLALRGCDPFQFSEFARAWYAKRPEHRHAADLLLAAWTAYRGEAIAVHSPSLVQHLPLPSTLGPRSRHRRSESFDRAFG
jgi:hypothetical protein